MAFDLISLQQIRCKFRKVQIMIEEWYYLPLIDNVKKGCKTENIKIFYYTDPFYELTNRINLQKHYNIKNISLSFMHNKVHTTEKN